MADKTRTGLIQIYTGNGKGKSTAAFGLALRAAGCGLRTAIVQFMKKGEWYGEIAAIKQLPLVDIYSYGGSKFLKKGTPPDQENLDLAAAAMAKARELMAQEEIDILILDEPLSGVDIEGEKQLLDMLDEVRRFYDQSILLSTHDFATLEEYADKVILLQSGVLKAGTPAEVLSSPEFQEVFHLSLGRGRG